MPNLESPLSARDMAWNRAFTARMNEYYHQARRRHWSMVAAWLQAAGGTLMAIGCGSLAILCHHHPGTIPHWFLWGAIASVCAGIALLDMRPEKRIETHSMLAIRYHYHARDLDRIFRSEDWRSLDQEVASMDETIALEAEREGMPHHATLVAAQNRVESELGTP